ncbi:MAG: PAS domain S-box protein, partial [Solirubrobacterales bacterium]
MGRIEDRSRSATGPLRPAPEAGEARFRALIEAGADGVLVVERDGAIGFANPAACDLLGRHAEDLIGRPFGIPVVPGETVEVDIPRGDGTVRIAEMRAAETSWLGVPAYLAALRDVTERKRAEEAAREAAATLRSFYDGAPMMMGVVELAGDDVLHVSANPAAARFFGIRPQDFEGRLAGRLGVPPGILGTWVDRYREAERTGAPVRFEYAHDTPAGRTWLLATVGYIGRTPVGRPQFSYVAEDVTERKRAEEALRDADRRKDEFLAMLAHELRNPLAAISNAAQLAHRAGSGDRWTWGHDVIGRQCAHLSRLIDDLLDVSRISRGMLELKPESVDLRAILERALELVQPLLDRQHQTVVIDAP